MLYLPMEAISPIEKKGNYSEETALLDFSSRTKRIIFMKKNIFVHDNKYFFS